jgi:hypothetical protein
LTRWWRLSRGQSERIVPLLDLGQEIDARNLVSVVNDADSGLLFWNDQAGFGFLGCNGFTRREAERFCLPCVTSAEPGWL